MCPGEFEVPLRFKILYKKLRQAQHSIQHNARMESFNAVGGDEAAVFFHVNRNGRPQTSALHDFAPDPNVAAKRADLQGIVDSAGAGTGHHGVGSAVPVLLRELLQVGYIFEVTLSERFPERKGPQDSTGEADHHRIQMFVRERPYKGELFRRPGLGKLFGGCCNRRALGIWTLGGWRYERGRRYLFRWIRSGGFRRSLRSALQPPPKCG